MRTLLAIDIGGTKSAVGLVDREGKIIARRRRPADRERGPEAMIADYVAMAHEVAAEAGIGLASLAGIGVCCGGPLDPWAGIVYSPPNLPGWDAVPLAAILRERLGKPVWIENDANGAALAEYWRGAGQGSDPLVYFTISTGVGGGVIIGGKIYHGATGNGAELGHLIVCANGRACGCGGRGCLETYCSGSSIAARAREAIVHYSDSALTRLNHPPRAEDVVQLASRGDVVARRLWDETLDLLAAGVASAIHAFEPRIVVLGGGVTRAGDALFVPLCERVKRLRMRALPGEARIVPTGLGDDVGLVGAAAVALAGMASVR